MTNASQEWDREVAALPASKHFHFTIDTPINVLPSVKSPPTCLSEALRKACRAKGKIASSRYITVCQGDRFATVNAYDLWQTLTILGDNVILKVHQVKRRANTPEEIRRKREALPRDFRLACLAGTQEWPKPHTRILRFVSVRSPNIISRHFEPSNPVILVKVQMSSPVWNIGAQ